MSGNVDPHLYKPSAGDVGRLNSADLIFYSGLNLEEKLTGLFARLAIKKPTFAVTQYLDANKLLKIDGATNDPHVWFDIDLWQHALEVVRDVLVLYDPEHAEEFRNNAAEYGQRLKQLHAYCQTQLARVPPQSRLLISAHDAFRYFGRAYQFEVRAIQGSSTENEAGTGQTNRLAGFIGEHKIKTVFIEASVPDRNIQALVEGCRANGQNVVIGGELFSDNTGSTGTVEDTFVGMVRHNIDTITSALK
jgi:manganese/zinc/iron transport system substrate-binding protein